VPQFRCGAQAKRVGVAVREWGGRAGMGTVHKGAGPGRRWCEGGNVGEVPVVMVLGGVGSGELPGGVYGSSVLQLKAQIPNWNRMVSVLREWRNVQREAVRRPQ